MCRCMAVQTYRYTDIEIYVSSLCHCCFCNDNDVESQI